MHHTGLLRLSASKFGNFVSQRNGGYYHTLSCERPLVERSVPGTGPESNRPSRKHSAKRTPPHSTRLTAAAFAQ